MKKLLLRALGLDKLEQKIIRLESEVERLWAINRENEELLDYIDQVRSLESLMMGDLPEGSFDELAALIAQTSEPIGNA